ncbi:MAG: nuclear transport factor 2 family protein [Bacteroidota bacterium]
MNLKYFFMLVFSALLITSCADKAKDDSKETQNAATASKNDAQKSTDATTAAKKDAVHIENVTFIKSFVEARNSYDAEKLRAITTEDYQEVFKNDFVEVNSQKEFLSNLEWAEELSAKTTIKEVISANDTTVVAIEKTTNYIDEALKRTPRNFKTTYFINDGKIVKQNFENAPGDKFDQKADDLLYGDFERFCEVRKIPFSWAPTKEEGKILRKALEQYANRQE